MYQNTRKFQTHEQIRRRQIARFTKKQHLDSALFVKKASSGEARIAYSAKHAFADFALHPTLLHNITTRGYTTPTPIQDQAIPHLLVGKDIIGLANTGTGKTAAFLLPLIQKILTNHGQNVLIIAPTRELAAQIHEELQAFTQQLPISAVLCIGGVSLGRQIFDLRKRPQFVIGTPGRLKDLEKHGKLAFHTYGTIVLDEVDRMLDMGFITDIRYIIKRLPQSRHAVFFSATLPDTARRVMQQFVTNPVTISVRVEQTAQNVTQDIVRSQGKAKVDVLHDLLVQEGFDKVLLFGRTKWGVEKLSHLLMERGFKVAAIHGNKNQNQRQKALAAFKDNKIQVLLATDIASRGIDVADVTHVINYDMPESYEDYIHRIGRTGRANKAGTALTFVD